MTNKVIWSKKEEEIIINNYKKFTPKELEKMLNYKKTYKQIKRKIHSLGFNHLNEKDKEMIEWTKEQDKYIFDNYKFKTIREISQYLNIDYLKVKRRFKHLNIKNLSPSEISKNKFLLKFTKDQIDNIKLELKKYSRGDIAKKYGFEYKDIQKLCGILDLEYKTRQEIFEKSIFDIDKEILEIGNGKSIGYISKKLNLDYKFVFRRCQILEINYVNDYPKWSKEETDKLIQLYKDTPLDDLILILHRSKGSILKKAESLDLEIIRKKYVDTTKLSDEQLEFLKQNYNEIPLKELCSKLQKDSRSIILKLKLLNLFDPLKGKGMTSLLETVVAKILNEMNFEYISQYNIYDNDYNKNVLCDFLIKNTNKVIEVYGDFWHGNPKMKKKNDLRDLIAIRKNNQFRENIISKHNYDLLIIWEHDLINELEKVYRDVKNFLEN